jgi:RHS repeat-associated protein
VGGRWLPVNLNLTRAPDGTLAALAHPEGLTFAGGRTTTTGALATLGSGAAQITMGWAGKLPAPVIDGTRATYADVRPGIDLVLESTRTGFEQFVVVKSREAASQVAELSLQLTGKSLVSHKRDTTGALIFKNKSGRTVATAPTPLMWDAQLNADGQTPKRRTVVKSAAAKRSAGVDLQLTPDLAWITDPATKFPVTIDPQVTVGASFDTYVTDGDTGDRSGVNNLQIGLLSGTDGKRTRSFVAWNTSALRYKQITAATASFYNYYSTTCSANSWEIWSTNAFDAGTRWSNQPAWNFKEGSSTATKGFSSSCADAYVSLTATPFFARAAAANQAKAYMGIRATSETATTAYKQFRSLDGADSAQIPKATVTYNSYPTVGTRSTVPATACATGASRPFVNTKTPTLKAAVTDADGGQVKAWLDVWQTGGTASLVQLETAKAASGSTLSAVVPAGKLAENGNYAWRSAGDDATTYSADGRTNHSWSPWCEFTVDTIAPTTAPAVSSTSFPAGQWSGAAGTAGTFTFGAADVADVAGYEWSLDSDQPDQAVNATAVGGSGTASVTPTTEGPHTLYVRSRDRAGNRSPIKQYSFLVGAGAVTAPRGGDLSTGTSSIEGIGQAGATGVTYQWRRGDADAWQDIPAADVVQAGGNTPITWPLASTGGGAFAKLNWNLAATLNAAEDGPDPLDGPLQLRANFTGGASVSTSAVKFALDRNRALAETANIGPGVVNLLTGNYAINRTDTGAGGNGVARTANSRQSAVVDPMFGPGWTSSVGAPALGVPYVDLTVTGSLVQVGRIAGGSVGFTKSKTTSTGATFEPQAGFEDSSLVYTTTGDTYKLVDEAGMTVVFGRGSGDPAGKYAVRTAAEAGSSDTIANSWQTVTVGGQTVVRPTQVLGAVPAGVSCSTSLVRGCSALKFVYATANTATGTAPEQWGDRTDRVKQITYTTWDPDASPAAMRTITVAAYAYDSNGRLRSAWDPRLDFVDGTVTKHVAETYGYGADGVLNQIQAPGQQPWQFAYTTLPGDTGAGRLASVSRATDLGPAQTTVVYHVPVTGTGAPYDLSVAQTRRWAQDEQPVEATAIFPATQRPDGNQAAGTQPSSYERAGISYFDANARTIDAAEPGGQITSTWFDSLGQEIRELTAGNREQALNTAPDDDAASEAAIAKSLSTLTTYSADGSRIVAKLDPEHDIVLPDGSTVRGRPNITYVYDEGAPASDDPFDQVTTETVQVRVWSADGTFYDTDKRTKKTQYDWTLQLPLKVTEDAGGLNLVTRYTYDAVTKEQKTVSTPASGADTTPATERTTYYRVGTGSGVTQCDSHPEWNGLVCRVDPGGQPATGSPVPSTVTTYDALGHPRTVQLSTSAGVLKTTTSRYDGANRLVETEVSVGAGLGDPVSVRRNVYDKVTGTLSKVQEIGTGNAVVSEVSYGYDDLGRPTSYTDADNNVSTTTYDILDRPATSSDGKATRTYAYDEGTSRGGQVTSVVDSQLGTFTASYNTNGEVTAQTWPNGVRTTLDLNEEDVATGITYSQPGCGADDCTLFSEQVAQSVHDQWRTRTSSLSAEEFDYDTNGRLVTVRDTVGGDCATRAYVYDAVANRKSSTAFPSAEDGSCQRAAGGVSSSWGYDTGDRIADAGYTYDKLGRNTVQPTKDAASGTGDATMAYYANDMVKSISQAGRTNTYTLDTVASRFRSWTQNDNGTTVTKRNHYSNDGDSPAWTDEGNGTYTRSVSSAAGPVGIFRGDGLMAWSLLNLHGDVVATMDSSTGLVATADYDEFGVARTPATSRYGWLGSAQRAADTPSGMVLMGLRLYNPSTGRFLSRDPVDGGGRNDFDYCGGDPLACSDVAGDKSIDCSGSWLSQRYTQTSINTHYSRWNTFWKMRTVRHGYTVNARCKLSHNVTKRLVEYGAGIGVIVGALLGLICSAGAVFCSIVGAIVGFLVGQSLPTEYETRCPQEKGLTLRETVKIRWGKKTIYWRWWIGGGRSTYSYRYGYGWWLTPRCNR